MINAIFAMTENGGIGHKGSLPWPHNSRDFRWFKSHTRNNMVVMGRNTWDDPLLPKPLPDRDNVIITNRALEFYPRVVPIKPHGTQSFLIQNSHKELFLIGGARVLNENYKLINRFYTTVFKGDYECDTFLSAELLEYMKSKRITYEQDYEDLTFRIWG